MTTQNEYQKLQILAEYSKKGLKVWINYQLALDISSDVLGSQWPSTGEWGFYFLGMDNFIADFRGYEQQISLQSFDKNEPFNAFDDKDPFAPDEKPAETTQCQKCGDGRVDTKYGETCDDGNEIPGDGCSERCIAEGPGWVCDTTQVPTVCYTGKIVSPKSGETIGSTEPTVIGTYQGGADYIHVMIEQSGTKVCEGHATITPKPDWQGKNKPLDGEWTFSTKDNGCKLKDGDYVIRAVLKTTKDATQQLEITSPFTVDQSFPTLTIDEPKGNPAATNQGSVTVSGTVKGSGSVDVSVSIKDKAGDDVATCTPAAISGDEYESQCTFKTSTGDGTYHLDVSATDSNNNKTTESKDIIVDKSGPAEPDFTNPTDGGTVKANPDGTINVEGNVPSEQGRKDGDGKSPSKVRVVVKSKSGETTTDIPVDRNGHFKGKVPLPPGGGPYTISGTTYDEAGNKSNPKTIHNVKVEDHPSANVKVVSPSEGEVLNADELDKGGPDLEVKGTSTPGTYYEITGVTYCEVDLTVEDKAKINECITKPVTADRVSRNPETGEWVAYIPKDKLGRPGEKVTYKIEVTTTNTGNQENEFISHFEVDLSSQGFVAGGCASVPGNPANDNLPILLLVGLGVVAIRRSRK